MIRVEIQHDEIGPVLDRLAASLTDMRPVMQEIGDALVYETGQRFERGVSPAGVPWTPKSKTTIETYRRRGGSVSFKPLIGPTKVLSTTIHHHAETNSVEVGSNAIQAAVMQFGAAKGAFGSYQGKGFGGTTPTISIPWGDIPARPFLGLSDIDRSNIIETVNEWLARIAAEGAVGA